MKILIVLTFTPIRLPCRQAILAAETRDGPPSWATDRWFLQPLHSPCRCRWDQILTYDISACSGMGSVL